MEMNIDDYIEMYNEIIGKVEDKEVAFIILQELGKDRRGREAKRTNDPRATKKQIDYLKLMGVSFSAGISKVEASALIDHAKNQQENEADAGLVKHTKRLHDSE
jgi:hypothetical protein